jgi:hypothetical protein
MSDQRGRPSEASSAPSREPSLIVGGLHLAVLWAFAFQRPLFDLLGRNPDFFVARGNTRGDILAYALAFTLVPPLVLLAVEWLVVRLRPAAHYGLHLALVGMLGAAFALQVLSDSVASGPAAVLIALALALGAALAWAYARTGLAPQALSVLSPAPILFLVVFLIFSDVHKLVLPQKKAEAAARVSSRAPVVVLLFDEFPISTLMARDGGIDARRFPNFAELAARSTWYRNTSTVADKTPRAVPAMLTGHNPGYRKLPIASDLPDNLFTLLGSSYDVDAVETATRMCPGSICHGSQATAGFPSRFRSLASDLRVVSEHLLLPDSLAKHLPPIGQTFGGFGSAPGEPQGKPRITARYQQDYDAKLRRERREATPGGKAEMFGEFVDAIDGSDRSFDFIDIQLPHFPWEYVETVQRYGQHYPDMDNFVIDDPPGRFIDNRWLVDQSYSRHLLQAGASDRLLGELIAKMKRVGIWDRAALVVSADHGVSFEPGGFRREVKAENLHDIAFVPLFVKAPGQRAGVAVEGHACTTDVPRLLSEALKIDWPWGSDRCDPRRIDVLDSFGSTRHGDVAAAERARLRTVRRKLALFGEGWEGVYHGLGPHPELVGVSSSALRHTGATKDAPGRVRFDKLSDVDHVDPAGSPVPALLQGTIAQTRAPAGLSLAIEVNGRVAAVTRAYELAGKTRFIALVRPRFYRRGRNSVGVFTIRDRRGQPELGFLGGVNLPE